MKVSILGFAVLSIVLGSGVSAAADAKFQAFKIGSYDAVALKDGDLQEPNDGKSFLVGQPTADVAAALEGRRASGGSLRVQHPAAAGACGQAGAAVRYRRRCLLR